MSNNTQTELNQALAEELFRPLPIWRQYFTYGMTAMSFGLTALALLPLLSILWVILNRGLSGLKPQMFTTAVIENGFGNAILGTLVMVGIAAVLSIPVGVMTGIFLAEFGQGTALAGVVRFVTTVLTGVPSIVVGVFAYGVIVFATKKFSAFAGGFALGTIMLPIVVLTTEEALKLIPNSLRLASAALGGSRLQTTFRIAITAALPGITTGVLLAVARASGETAPLLFTALFSQNWSDGLFSPTASLSVLMFNLYNDPSPEKNALVWTAAIVLVSLVLLMNLLSRLATRQR